MYDWMCCMLDAWRRCVHRPPPKGQRSGTGDPLPGVLVSSVWPGGSPETPLCFLCALDPGGAEGHGREEVWGGGEASRQVRSGFSKAIYHPWLIPTLLHLFCCPEVKWWNDGAAFQCIFVMIGVFVILGVLKTTWGPTSCWPIVNPSLSCPL